MPETKLTSSTSSPALQRRHPLNRSSPISSSPIRNNAYKQRESQKKLIETMEHKKEHDDNHLLLDDFDRLAARRRGSTTHLESYPDLESVTGNELDSYVVIEFAKDINRNTLYWIIDKIRSKKSYGGAELLLTREPSPPNEGLTIHISATKIKLLELADELGLMKKTRAGLMRNFNVVSLDDFFIDESMDIDDILTPADCQYLVKYALENIKAKRNERSFPGTEIEPLYHGESIIQAAITNGMIHNMFSLHEKEFLKKLGPNWYNKIYDQPIHSIREYFGEAIGIYFAFVGFYTVALVVPTVLGLVQCMLSYEAVPFFCIFYVVWMTVFTEIWKRRCSILAYKWGTIVMTNLDMPRIGYYGKIGKDPITGKMTPRYPLYKTHLKMYLVSFPIIMMCLTFATFLTLSQFWAEDYIRDKFGPDSYILYIPSIIQSTLVALLSLAYEYLATWLTDLENHRTQIQYERHRVNKLIILEFVNNFLSLFYIAFVLKDIKQLRAQLMTQLIIVQAFQNLKETLYPIVKVRAMKLMEKCGWITDHTYTKLEYNDDQYDELNISKLEADDPKIKQNHFEKNLEEYNSTYEDYLELYIQFGYVVLFSSVAPLAAFWAFVNNVIEIRVDAFKLCRVYRRPFAKRAKDTGAWLLAFQVLSLMSIVTNCGIILLTPQIKELGPSLSDAQWVIVLIVLEHSLFIVTWFIHKAIPDCPHWIRVALAKADYESRQALKRERGHQSKTMLFRRFKSVYEKGSDHTL